MDTSVIRQTVTTVRMTMTETGYALNVSVKLTNRQTSIAQGVSNGAIVIAVVKPIHNIDAQK